MPWRGPVNAGPRRAIVSFFFYRIDMPNSSLSATNLPWPYRLCALIAVQIAGGMLATFPVTGFTRPAVLLVTILLITAASCTWNRFRSRYCLLIVVVASVATVTMMQVLRSRFGPTWFFGPLPADVQLTASGGLVLLTVMFAAFACAVFSSSRGLRRFRWAFVAVMASLLVGLAILARQAVWQPTSGSLLRRIVQLEELQTSDLGTTQELSVMLAICGRETEAEATTRWTTSSRASVPPASAQLRSDLSHVQALPWRETLTDIARRHRIIIIMEAHNAPKHRQWIEQTLSILQAAGFQHYAAEALSESGASLRQRGYPSSTTGFYVADPHFGNVLRTAIDLDFDLHAYEAHGTNFAQRESGQATNLAGLFEADPDLKIVIHAGYGHVFKTPLPMGENMMAVHLWQMTGIEPFCIWQTWHGPDQDDARRLAQLADADREPFLLVPPPKGLSDPQFQFPRGAVDAIVVHSPSSGGPAERVHSFPSTRDRITGVWNGSEWPVLIGAFRKGESPDAIALDQVMLRQNERNFVLWVPSVECDIRAFGLNGPIEFDAANSLSAPGITH